MTANVQSIRSGITNDAMDDRERLMTVEGLAVYLGISTPAVYSMRHRGDGPPAIRLGSGKRSPVRYRRTDVDQWLDQMADPA